MCVFALCIVPCDGLDPGIDSRHQCWINGAEDRCVDGSQFIQAVGQ